MNRRDIFNPIQDQNILKRPKPKKGPAAQRNCNKYYKYHQDYEHDTEECFKLKKEIEALIRRGQLKHYVAQPNQRREQPPPRREEQLAPPAADLPLVQDIWTIIGGSNYIGDSNHARKTYARRTRYDDDGGQLFLAH